MTRTRRAALSRLAAASVLLAALAGCSMDRLGSAAVIQGEPIKTDRVQELSQEYLEVVPDDDPGEVQRAVLQQLIVGRVFAAVAEQRDLRVRPGRVAEALDGLLASTGGRRQLVEAIATQAGQIVPPSMLEEWMKHRLLFEKLALDLSGATTGPPSNEALDEANAELTRVARRLDIELNPRYGDWNPGRGIQPLVGGGLSKTVEEITGGRS